MHLLRRSGPRSLRILHQPHNLKSQVLLDIYLSRDLAEGQNHPRVPTAHSVPVLQIGGFHKELHGLIQVRILYSYPLEILLINATETFVHPSSILNLTHTSSETLTHFPTSPRSISVAGTLRPCPYRTH